MHVEWCNLCNLCKPTTSWPFEKIRPTIAEVIARKPHRPIRKQTAYNIIICLSSTLITVSLKSTSWPNLTLIDQQILKYSETPSTNQNAVISFNMRGICPSSKSTWVSLKCTSTKIGLHILRFNINVDWRGRLVPKWRKGFPITNLVKIPYTLKTFSSRLLVCIGVTIHIRE